jgi:hypothetical protein
MAGVYRRPGIVPATFATLAAPLGGPGFFDASTSAGDSVRD